MCCPNVTNPCQDFNTEILWPSERIQLFFSFSPAYHCSEQALRTTESLWSAGLDWLGSGVAESTATLIMRACLT